MKGLIFCLALIFAVGTSAENSDSETNAEAEDEANRNIGLAIKEISAKRSIAAAEEELRNVTEFFSAFADLFPTADGEICQLSFEPVEQDILEAKAILNSIVAPIDHNPATLKSWGIEKAKAWDAAIESAENARLQCLESLHILQQHILIKEDLTAIQLCFSEAQQQPLVDQIGVAELESRISTAINNFNNAEFGVQEQIEKLEEALTAMQIATQKAQVAEQKRLEARKHTIKRMAETTFLLLMILGVCYRAAH